MSEVTLLRFDQQEPEETARKTPWKWRLKAALNCLKGRPTAFLAPPTRLGARSAIVNCTFFTHGTAIIHEVSIEPQKETFDEQGEHPIRTFIQRYIDEHGSAERV